jgi:hypothetical protein
MRQIDGELMFDVMDVFVVIMMVVCIVLVLVA